MDELHRRIRDELTALSPEQLSQRFEARLAECREGSEPMPHSEILFWFQAMYFISHRPDFQVRGVA